MDICPQYEEPLIDRQVSTTAGNFSFSIDSTLDIYFAQYCAGGYMFETRDNNLSKPDGTPVRDTPILLTPRRPPQ